MPEAPRLRVAAFRPRARANGPGVRAVLWVQGCPRRCAGCCNQGFLDPSGGTDMAVEDVARLIEGSPRSDGLTLSGGEPLEQATALAWLVRRLRSRRDTGVVCFTGYTLEALDRDPPPGAAELLAVTDLLVDGPYDRRRAAPLLWRASANQRLHHLTPRYARFEQDGELAPGEAELATEGSRVVRTGDVAGSALDEVTDLLRAEYGVAL